MGFAVVIARAWIDGLVRVARAPLVLAGVWLMTMAASLPLAVVLRSMIIQQLGSSTVAESVANGVNYEWMQEFADQATGIGVTFKPTIIGFGAVLDNLSAFVDNTPRPVVVVAAASAYIVLWLFLAGGIIDRYARNRRTGAHGFFSACGAFFVRFLRLAVVQWIIYAMLFGSLHPLLFERAFPNWTRDSTVERNAFFVRVALYLVFILLVAAFNLLFDYAKVRAVVEDRRSVIGATGAAARFIIRNPAAAGLYLLNVALFAVTVALYAAVAPGAGHSGLTMWLAFAIGQFYVLVRLWVKLVFWASETALFQSRLAHAGYVGSPEASWPDSPAAEAIRPEITY